MHDSDFLMQNRHLHSFVLFFTLAICGWTICFFKSRQDSLQSDELLSKIFGLWHERADIIFFGDSVLNTVNPIEERTAVAPTEPLLKTVIEYLAADLNVKIRDASYSGSIPTDFIPAIKLLERHDNHYELAILQVDPVTLARPKQKALHDLLQARYNLVDAPRHAFKAVAHYVYLKNLNTPNIIASKAEEKKLVFAIKTEDSKTALDLFHTQRPMSKSEIFKSIQIFQQAVQGISNRLLIVINPIDRAFLAANLDPNYLNEVDARCLKIQQACKDLHIDCLDLHSLIPQSSHYYDGHRVHLDAYGRQTMAKAIAEYIRGHY